MVQVKLFLCLIKNHIEKYGEWVIAPRILNLSTRWQWVDHGMGNYIFFFFLVLGQAGVFRSDCEAWALLGKFCQKLVNETHAYPENTS
jgi:hypothetical protein